MSNTIKLHSKARLYKGVDSHEIEMIQDIALQQEKKLNHEREIERQYKKGYDEGYQSARQELENDFTNQMLKKTEEFYSILSSFEEKLCGYESIFDELVIRLSAKISGKILRYEIKNNPIIEETLRSSIKKIMGANEVHIKIHPGDYELLHNEGKTVFIERNFDKIKFEISEKIEPGGCVIETEIGNVDARIESQLNEITKQLENSVTKNV